MTSDSLMSNTTLLDGVNDIINSVTAGGEKVAKVPIYSRNVDLTGTVFERLTGLPKNKISLDQSPNLDSSLMQASQEIGRVC